ncbi:Plant invertase/pectin methylesterase inhibitor superfamily protein [Euphorbia peplus]|nr:Plant invertase/pectin methylesterase inhibitor superfamily protein [Euphorbia peplus]
MAIPKSIFLFLLISTLYLATPSRSTKTTPRNNNINYIKSSCKSTTYPSLCVQSLASYAPSIQQNPRQLTETALSVSISRAQSTKTFIYKLTKFNNLKKREVAAVKDCYEEISDTVDRLSKAYKEMKSVGHGNANDFQWHMSNVETWVSAALTDENTCVDGFAGKALDGRLKNSIKVRIVNVAQVTSNALALITKFANSKL